MILRWMTPLLLALVVAAPTAASGEEACTPFDAETFPFGMVWWRVDPDRAAAADVQGFRVVPMR